MSNNCTSFLLGICLVASSISSCEQRDEAAVQAVIQERVASNIAQFKARQLSRCHREAMDAAVLQADSIVIAIALAAKDTSLFTRPRKPVKPTVVIPTDNTPIAPLFKDSL